MTTDTFEIMQFTNHNLNWFDRIIFMGQIVSKRPAEYYVNDIDRLGKFVRSCGVDERVFEVAAVMLLGDAHHKGYQQATRWLESFINVGGVSGVARQHASYFLQGFKV